MAIEYAMADICPDIEVYENYKEKDWKFPLRMDVDIYIPEMTTAIEYDSWVYHRGKEELEQYKNDLLAKNGVDIIRVRDDNLPKLRGDKRTYWYNGEDEYSKQRAMDHAIKYVAEEHRKQHQTDLDNSTRFFSKLKNTYKLKRVKTPKMNLEKRKTQAAWAVANTEAQTRQDVNRIRRDAGYERMPWREKRNFRNSYERQYWDYNRYKQ